MEHQSQSRSVNDFIFDANRDLERKVINAEEFLDRMTSAYSNYFSKLFECAVNEMDQIEIDDIKDESPPVSTNTRLCQLCEKNEAVVTLGCGDQMLCVDCFKEYSLTLPGYVERQLDQSGNPIVNSEFPLQCPHCRVDVTSYSDHIIFTR